MTTNARIALLDRGVCVVQGILQGIREYAADRPHWVLRDCPPRANLIAHVVDWRPHGIIAGLVLPKMARALVRLGLPVVDIAYFLPGLKTPTVDVDPRAAGRLAAEELLRRKFLHFGFFGSELAVYAKHQEASFRQRIVEAGRTVSSCYEEFLSDVASPRLWQKTTQNTQRWLRRLSKPVAILCCDDLSARYLADVCGQIGLNIPNEVALLGIGNDALECELTRPTLSSVAIPSRRIGYEAAAILDRMMTGGTAPKKPFLLPPLHVVTRQSTDVLAVEDETLRAALRYIRDHAAGDISVAALARDLSVGRRPLERRFRQILGRSILDEIHHVRVQRAKELLAETETSVTAVAAQAGFPSIRRLDVVFARLVGMSPSAYRQRARAK